MVWLETATVTIDGKESRVVYPRLYLRAKSPMELKEDGSLLGASEILLETKESLENSGLLLGENIRAEAGSIKNRGVIRGNALSLKSRQDIAQDGQIEAKEEARLRASGSFRMENKIERLKNQDVLAKTAGIAVQGENGVLLVSAEKDLRIAGGALSALGKNGSLLLAAGKDIALDTDKLQSKKDMTADAANYLRTERSIEIGTSLEAGGAISLHAGNDLEARAANIASENGTVSLAAGSDIRLTAGRETAVDRFAEKHKANGFLSTTTTTLRSDSTSDTARGTNVAGKNVSLAARRDVMLQAANIVADESIGIAAGRNFSAETAENYAHTDSFREVKKSGIFSSGELGFTIGTQKQKTERESSVLEQAGTNIAALKGDVRITAGDTAHLTSASVLAGHAAAITAKETRLDGKENIYRDVFTQESQTTGLTVSLGHGLLSLGQEIAAPLQRIGEVKDDRLKAVYAWKAGRLIQEAFSKGNPLQQAAGLSLNLSLGTSKTYSRTESVTKEYAGTTIRAGGTASLTAAEHDLSVKGSQVAGKDVSLKAKGDVRLEAGENTSVTTSENKTSAASIGASFSPQGLSGLSLSASSAKGKSKESRTSYTPTEVKAAGTLKLESGKDTNILGSKAKGEKIEANVGGNLTIETLQEKETYEEKNTSAGFNLSWSMNQMLDPAGSDKILRSFSKPTFGLSANRGTIDSHYRSVREQSASSLAKAASTSTSRRTPTSRARSSQVRRIRRRIVSARGRSLSAIWRTVPTTARRASGRHTTTTVTTRRRARRKRTISTTPSASPPTSPCRPRARRRARQEPPSHRERSRCARIPRRISLPSAAIRRTH